MPTLYLLRHAKSAWDREDLEDHDRPLAPRGRRAARALATHFREAGIVPDLVLCSTAARARETLDLVMAGFPDSPLTAVERGLYLASGPAILARLRRIEAEIGAAMVIGHNPGLHELALALATRGKKELRAALAAKFPTGALATYEIEGEWAALKPGAARLAAYVVPADLRET